MFQRYAHVRQDDQSDCGAAALATVALHYRKHIGVQALRDLAGTDRIGTNLMGLMEAAQQLGFWAKGVQGDFDALQHADLPAIAHIKNEEGLGHFIVLHKVTRKYVVVSDPARGIEKQTKAEFCDRWSGYLLLLAPDDNANIEFEDAEVVSPWRRYVGLLTTHKFVLFEGFICALLMTVLGLSSSFFIQHLVDSVLVRNEDRLLNALGVGMALILIFRMLFGVLRQYLLAHAARKIDLSLVSKYARHVLGLPMNFFEMRQVGEILSRVTDASKVRHAVSGTALSVMVDGVMVTISVAVLWCYDARLAAVATAFVPLLVIGIMLHHSPVKRKSREAMEQSAKLSAHLVEDISGVETVKAFGLETARSQESEQRLVKLTNTAFSMQKLGISMNSIGLLVTGSAGIAILWYGGHRVMAGALSIGQLMFFNTLVGYMLGPLERLASVNVSIQEALVALDRLYQVMDLRVETGPGVDHHKAEFRGVSNAIEVKNVDFKYGCRDKVLKEVDLTIPAGQTVAIVGESGSGKSTLLKLLTRFHDPVEGQILVDGVDLRDYDIRKLRAGIGLVSQDAFVFNATIRDNIAVGRPEAPMNEVVDAARSAGLEEFISKLPDRYETVIGERGANLSGGQRQRLAIARALLLQPEVLIFDEATSHLDTTTEQAIQHNLQTQLKDKTAIFVAHRLSTIKDADLIYVLHDGQVAEQGTHASLLEQHGRYAKLWSAQTGSTPTVARESSRRNGVNSPAVALAN